MMRVGVVLVFGFAFALSACGTRVPDLQEVWEPVGVNDDLKLKVRAKIYCELVDAVHEARKAACGRTGGKREPCLSDDYGVQMQTTITIDESTALNPSVGLLDAWTGGSISTNITGTFSSTATRIDTSYSYHNIARMLRDDVKETCNKLEKLIDYSGSSMLLRADLGITKYLTQAMDSAFIIHSQAGTTVGLAGQAKQAKFDVFSYQVKFVVVTSGGVNPVLKLTSLATGVGGPAFLTAGRTRTHDLVLTFGPGKEVPELAALQVHNGQVIGKQK
ncbi:MAG: hypothetical protein WCC12_09385 [Anaerolineales bacterium]